MEFLESPSRFLFFTGKGGVGKTSIACAVALNLTERGRRVLLVSTDPASNLDQALRTTLGTTPTPVMGAPGLSALNIDPEATAHAYRERALAHILGTASDQELADAREHLSGACTVEIAAFDRFTALLTSPDIAAAYDHVVFDTAPTGHTLRLLALPAAWSQFIDTNRRGSGCLGPAAALDSHHAQYRAAVSALGDPALTTLVLVTRPERGALGEAARTSADLRDMGLDNQHLVVNGRFRATDRTDRVALAWEQRGERALAQCPPALADLPRSDVPLRPFDVVGLPAIRAFLDDTSATPMPGIAISALDERDYPALKSLVDEIAAAGHGLIMVMGKGGVGKTTIAAAIAVELAGRGHPVHLTTTDPAAHVAATVEGELDLLTVGRIDPSVERAAYVAKVMSTRGRDLDDAGRALLLEDLQSPCTEEVAVFHAFSRFISKARTGFVVVDTAPTGHTVLLLDTTGAYHTEIVRSMDGQRGLSGATTPLMRLRDPNYTKTVIVTLPETTPVTEAAQLQAELRRAGIEPYAWVVNGSLAISGVTDPLLGARARAETRHIERVRDELARRVSLVPWQPEPPIGIERLRTLATRTVAV